MNSSTNVYLADLRYNFSGVLANDCMPLGVAYMKAVMDQELPEVNSRLFVYPDKLWQTILESPPDVLMLSNYVWNEALSFHIAKLTKRLNPDVLVVMGGPNISLEDERRMAYLQSHPEVDLYVLGEGDYLASEVVRHFLDAGKSVKKMGDREIPSSVYRRSDGSPYVPTMWERHKEIDDLPSPWLTGIQDEFFDGKLAPLIETNRGCPFTCTFCVQGTRWYTKVHNFSVDRIKAEIDYIAHRIKKYSPSQGTLRIADSNFGMFERDVEISEHIGHRMKDCGYPKFIDATTGKNRPDRIIRSVEKVSGALVLYQAVQSLDENVLRNVKRQTIKLEAYEQLQVHMRGRGLRSNSDLILGLPGETIQTHLAASYKLLDSGISQVTNFQLMLLKGSELETVESRQSFRFESRFRVLPKNFGIVGGEKVFDVEEIVVATDTLSFDDYVECRKRALISMAFWRDDLFEDVVVFLGGFGIPRSECWKSLLPALEQSTGKARRFLDDFVRETIGELFPSREACIDFYSQEDNFQRLLRGEIGDNLMHKYHAIAVFHLWPEVCDIAMGAFRRLLVENGGADKIPEFDTFWSDLHRFVQLKHAHGYSESQILAHCEDEFEYDIPTWLEHKMPPTPAAYSYTSPQRLGFRLTPEAHDGLKSALEVWSTDIRGLTKMVTRIKSLWLHREVTPLGSAMKSLSQSA